MNADTVHNTNHCFSSLTALTILACKLDVSGSMKVECKTIQLNIIIGVDIITWHITERENKSSITNEINKH